MGSCFAIISNMIFATRLAGTVGAGDDWSLYAFVQRLPQLLEHVQVGNERV